MIIGNFVGWRVAALGVLLIVATLGPVGPATAAELGQKIFSDQCAPCHTIGRGKLVGPDLAGVTTRREESWLTRQIKDPERMIAEKDPIALQLLKQSSNVPMATLGLSDEQVAAVIAFLKSTASRAAVSTGIPSQYVPTILISVVLLIALTLIGLAVGRKKVDVR